MSPNLPAPLVPPDCDLRDLPAIMLQRSIFDSDLAMLSTGDEFKAAFHLYGACYGQVPAGSLPFDDRSLAFLSRASASWPKVKNMALRGWFQCSDGRLYHRITAEKVLVAWIGRLKQRLKAKAGGASKNQTGGFDARPIEGQINVAYHCLERVAPDCREVDKWRRQLVRNGVPQAVPQAVPEALPQALPEALPQAVPVQCQGKGEAEGQKKDPSQNSGELVHLGSARAGAAA